MRFGLLSAGGIVGTAVLMAAAGGASEPYSQGKPAVELVVVDKFPVLDKALKDQKQKVVLVNFWATWCGPCVKKFPVFVELHKTYSGKGLTCVSVSLDNASPVPGTPDEILTFLKEKGAAFPNFVLKDLAADEKELAKRFGEFDSIPYMVMFDRSGKKVWDSDAKPLKFDELEKLIKDELAK